MPKQNDKKKTEKTGDEKKDSKRKTDAAKAQESGVPRTQYSAAKLAFLDQDQLLVSISWDLSGLGFDLGSPKSRSSAVLSSEGEALEQEQQRESVPSLHSLGLENCSLDSKYPKTIVHLGGGRAMCSRNSLPRWAKLKLNVESTFKLYLKTLANLGSDHEQPQTGFPPAKL